MEQNPRNVLALKSNNRSLILECIRRQPMSRADISRRLQLSKSAVTMLTAELIKEGLLREAGLSEKSNQLGRTSILLDLVPSYAFAIGVTLHRKRVGVCATDLKANCLFRVRESIDSFATADEAVAWVGETVRRELAQRNLPFDRCVGIGISSPGPLDHRRGVILEPPRLPLFRQYPVIREMEKLFDCPIYLENNSVALAQLDFYRRGGLDDNTLFVVAADGIGSALLLGGQVFRGSQGLAGEFGHVSIDPTGEPCSCGNRGCLEQYVTLSAMKQRFGFSDYEEVVNKAIDGDAEALQVIAYLESRLGTALVSCANLYDLDRVVLFGEYSYRAEWLNHRLQNYIKEHSLVCRLHEVAVESSNLSLEDKDLASAISALNGFFADTRSS